MGVRIYDTPGVPSFSSITSHIKNPYSILNIVPSKRINPYSIRIKSGQSVWIGGIAKIDMLNGD